jgi:general nucleoside transport system permease protein
MIELLTNMTTSAVLAGGVLALAALGETLGERVGVINLGLEGLIAMGAVVAVLAVFTTGNPWLGLLAAAAIGLALGSIFALAAVVVRANQILCGLALTFIGLGLAKSIGNPVAGRPVTAQFVAVRLPLLSDIPILGRSLFNQPIPVYFALLLLPVSLHFLLFRTRHGLNIRAVGEDPGSADVAGISVMSIRFLYVCVGAALTTIAGAYLTLVFIPTWSDGVTAGRGWIAIALVIFARYQPLRVVLGAILFGFVTALGFAAQALNWPISPVVLSALPYVLTLLVLIGPALRLRTANAGGAPAALGQPYFREERN